MQSVQSFSEIIQQANQLNLYNKLVQQLNKDFLLANINVNFQENCTPLNLKTTLQETIYRLIHEKFAEYLNLLYIIDVSETQIKKLNGSDTLNLTQNVTFLILKREWQKVWFKQQYS